MTTHSASQNHDNSLAHWNQLASHNPEQAADELLRRLEAVPAEERRKAIVAMPERAQLAERFAAASAGASAGATTALRGVPYLLKDLFDVRGELTGCSSPVTGAAGRPAERDGHLQTIMLDVGGVYCGRTHMNEFAYGLDGKNAHFGNCPNPHDAARVSGGSSSGSAWAVGKGIVPLAFGTDTGGSVRVPASYCGVYGFRRGVDNWATDGVFPLASSFDTVGWFTPSATDMQATIAELWEAGAAAQTYEESKPGLWYLPESVPTPAELREPMERIAELVGTARDRAAAEALDALLPDATTAYNVIGSSEAYEVHKDWLEPYREQYDPVVWALIDRGRHWSPGRREEAEQVKAKMRALVSELLERYGFVALPAVAMPTPLQEEIDATYRSLTLQLSVTASLSGFPVLTIPVPVAPGTHGGVQIVLPPQPNSLPREILDRVTQ